jgi:tRNA G10  N-methylase Trm11
MKTFFILGRNPELSKAEISEFLRARDRSYKEILFENNLLIIDTDNGEFDIQEFGGVMWLGNITFEGSSEEFEKYVDQNEIVPADKFSYSVIGNQEEEILKEKFKKEKKRASVKHGRQQIQFQDGTKDKLAKADFLIIYHEHHKTIYFGTATQNYNNIEVKNRDMNKPVRRESLAISPRLSKILINLSGAKPKDLVLDPFCGIGGILQEALLKNINVYGIDKDKQATEDAKTNLNWIKDKYNVKNTYKIENNNSTHASDMQFSAIATETPLGKLLTRKPNKNQSKQMVVDFEAYIIPILRRLKLVKKRSARIAITFPVIQDIHTDVNKIAQKTNLKVRIGPIFESRPDQFISRDIIVFE